MSRAAWRRALPVAACAFFAASGLAHAAPAHVSLRWSAPDECPDDSQLVHQIEALLGQSLLETREQALSVRVSAQGDAEHGYAAKLSFTSPEGSEERVLEHPSCEKLVEALSLVIALAIDPERVRSTQSARESNAVTVPGPSPAKIEQSPPLQPSPSVAPRSPQIAHEGPRSEAIPVLPGLRLAVHGLAGAGPLPDFGGGVEAALGWQSPRFRAELLGRYWVPRDRAIAGTSADLRLELVTLGARACWSLPTQAWRVSACAGNDWGNLRGTGQGLENSRSRDALYAQLSGGVQVAYTRSRLVPEGGFEVSGALLRPPFGFLQDGQQEPLFRPAAWGFGVFLGVAFEL